MTDIVDVFMDEGSAGVKTMWLEDGKIMRDVMPSRVVQDATTVGAGQFSDAAYLANGDEWTVAPFMDGTMPTNIRSYQTSAYNRVLVHEALRKNNFGGKKIRITTTLPIAEFFAVKPRNQTLIDQKKANLLEPVVNLAGHQLAEIVEVLVSPEATPAWMNYLLDDNGVQVVEADESNRILVVDQGGTTTDMAIIDGIGNIQKLESVRIGGFKVSDNLRPMIERRFDRKKVENHQLDLAMKEGIFAGDDISQEIVKACSPVENRILTAMEIFQPDSGSLDAVLYVGGLSSLTTGRLSAQYGGVTIKGDEFTIVQGLIKQYLNTRSPVHAED